MTKQQETLQGHISDMKGATDHLVEAFARQAEDAEVKKNPKIASLTGRLQSVAASQSAALKVELERFGTTPVDPVKHALSAISGAMAGLYDKVRSNPVSRMLRDGYTALSLAVVSNSMLHVTALAANEASTARLALSNMEQLAPLIIEVGEAILPVVESELSADFPPSSGAAATALKNVQSVWSRPHTNV